MHRASFGQSLREQRPQLQHGSVLPSASSDLTAQTRYVNINHRREINMNYAANNAKSKKNTRANHVFNLQ